MNSSARSHATLSKEELAAWPSFEPLALTEEERYKFERRQLAVLLYVRGTSLKEIKAATGIKRDELYRRIKRSRVLGANGSPLGWRAFCNARHVSNSQRKNSFGKLTSGPARAGCLQALFAKYPHIHRAMLIVVLDGVVPGSSRKNERLTWDEIYEVFAELCTRAGIKPPDYPFCSNSAGRVALRRWGKRLRQDAQRAADRAAQQRKAATLLPSVSASRFYADVECDGHWIDVRWSIVFPSLRGDEDSIYAMVERIWLIALIERRSSAVIGYTIAFGTNYDAAAVARAVQSSLVPWQPRALTITTIGYKQGECLPNAYHPLLAYVRFDALYLDNALAHLAGLFLASLDRAVGAVPVFGPKGTPNSRPHIEGLFDLIEEAGLHKVDGTLGANPRDPRRTMNAGTPFTLSHAVLLDLIDILVMRYNTGIAPGTTISRLEVLRRAVERETVLLRYVPPTKRETCMKYDLFDEAVIGLERGKPVVRWKNARYKGSGLLERPGLVGRKILIMASSRDLRLIEASLMDDGWTLGTLEIERRWRSTPNTHLMRSTTKRVLNNNNFLKLAADIPRAVRQHQEMEAKESARAKRDLARIAAEQAYNGSAPAALPTAQEQPQQQDEPVNLDAALVLQISQLKSVYRG